MPVAGVFRRSVNRTSVVVPGNRQKVRLNSCSRWPSAEGRGERVKFAATNDEPDRHGRFTLGGSNLLPLACLPAWVGCAAGCKATIDRKSTRLNSSHLVISYAVF